MNTKSTTDIDRTVGLRIPLTKGMFALVDEADFAEVSATKWSLSQTRSGWYAVRVGHREEGGFGRIYPGLKLAFERGEMPTHPLMIEGPK